MKLLVLLAGAAAVITGLVVWNNVRLASTPFVPSVLGRTFLPGQTHFDTLILPAEQPPPPAPSPIPVTATPTIQPSIVTFIDGPGEMVEGDIATFTWYVNGPSAIIHTTAIYYGTTSDPGVLVTQATPESTRYTKALTDFFDGNYSIPLRFVGSINQLVPGTYFYRAYAAIGGKHYWSGERSFIVTPIPKHGITIIDRPGSLSPGGNAAFTWDIYGPAGATGFTAIVGGKQSLPGGLESTVDIPKTPYAVLVQDFTSGTYSVPLRFIGNAKVQDAGTYYFRAIAFINGKNIWSDEYSFIVK